MSIDPSIKELPEQYHALSTINSAEQKTQLAELIGDILRLLGFFAVVTPEPKTQLMIDHFFGYLNKCCDNPHDLNKRARWLRVYATVVRDHLLTAQHGPLRVTESTPIAEDEHFAQVVVDLITELGNYYQFAYDGLEFDRGVMDEVKRLVCMAGVVVPDRTDGSYLDLYEKVNLLAETFIDLVRTKSVMADEDRVFTTKLRHINHLVETYICYHQHLSKS